MNGEQYVTMDLMTMMRMWSVSSWDSQVKVHVYECVVRNSAASVVRQELQLDS